MIDLIDSHCHLTYFSDQEQDEIVKRAKNIGVSKVVSIGTKLSETDKLISLAKKYPDYIYITVATHPEYANEFQNTYQDVINEVNKSDKIIAIGEPGLDYYYSPDNKKEQLNLFEEHLKAAEILDIPVCIHTRNAEDDTIELLKKYPKVKFLLHCFSSEKRLLDYALERDMYISASGIITFKKSIELCELFKYVPINRLLVETDTPYLAPVPYRGKTNEPSYVVKTAEKLAQIKEVTLEELCKETTNNFYRFFKRAKR
ncbi:MAG: TatD family hydrolase [Alphaproteobacteria bacterium]|nr:TatD family hydrolase [Alphaproteobacteria bacterium]